MTKNTFCIQPTVFVPKTLFSNIVADATLDIVLITYLTYFNNTALG